MAIESIGRSLIVFGVVLIVIGAVFMAFGKLPWFGRLPGDIIIKGDNVTFYFPIVTMLIVSAVLTLLFNIIGRR